MANELAVLRIPVDGEWEANDWAEFFNAVDNIYSRLAILEIAEQLLTRDTKRPREKVELSNRVRRLMALATDPSRRSQDFLKDDDFRFEKQLQIDIPPVLVVIALKYGSEGFSDFLGHGKVVKAICSSFDKLIDTLAGHKGRKIANRIAQTKLNDELVEQFVKAGATTEQAEQYRRALLEDSDPVFRKLIKKGKLPKKAEILTPPPNYLRLPPPAVARP
jgi:hypothetical protein